ncbi:hypothetical protein VTK26DRAFT_3502 [Humicola hyalothermophila]
MGAGRGKTVAKGHKKPKHPEFPRSASTSAPVHYLVNGQSYLCKNLPMAGMIYLSGGLLLKRQRYKIVLSNAVKQGIGKGKFHIRELGDFFAKVFDKATAILRKDEAKNFQDNPLLLVAAVKERPALRSWNNRFPMKRFFAMFMTFRAARKSWFASPRGPFAVAEHCKIAHAIDRFNEARTINWSGPVVVEWMISTHLNDQVVEIKPDKEMPDDE